jgi:hypothetical protein
VVLNMQRWTARYVTGSHRNRSSVNTMLEDLKWKSLQTRRKERQTDNDVQNYKLQHTEYSCRCAQG